MKLFIFFFLLIPFIFVETTLIPLVFTLSFIFSVGLVIRTGKKYFMAFMTGLLFDLLAGKELGATSAYFLILIFILDALLSFLPKNFIVKTFFFIIAEFGFLIFNGIFPSIYLIISGVFIFQMVFIIAAVWLKTEENQQLEFDFLTSRQRNAGRITPSYQPRYFKRNRKIF